MVTLKKIRIRKIESLIIKGDFGSGKYFGYKKEKLIGLTKIYSNTGNVGIGESLVGAYSPILFTKNLNFISAIIKKKNIFETLKILENIQKNKFFFNNGILKSIIAAIEIAIINLISEIKCQSFAKTTNEIFFKDHNLKINNYANIYSSAGSINSNLNDLKRDIIKSKKLNIDKIKIRISTNSNFKSKIDLLTNHIKDFSVDLITNTYEKNKNHNKLKIFLNYVKRKNPLWVEEVLNVNDLESFINIRQKFKLKFSYGENFNSLNDFVGLIKYYKFDYINPDITHMPISELARLIKFLKDNNLKNKIIFHCWGSVANIYSTLQLSRLLSDFVKLVEFPITDFSLNNEFIEQAKIYNSKFYFDNSFILSQYYLKMKNIKNNKILKKYSFNFD